MVALTSLMNELDERTIALKVGIPHDNARVRYRLDRNTVSDFDDFTDVITDYEQHHVAACVAPGAALSRAQAGGRAKEQIEEEYRRRHGGNLVTAFNDAQDGTNGGLRRILDIIAEKLKAEAVERHIRHAFDTHVSPDSWEGKVALIREFLDRFGHTLSPSIRVDQAARYAQNYQDLIRSYLKALQETSSVFRQF